MVYCIFCGKKLRLCKRVDFLNRRLHLSCIERQKKIIYQQELEDFKDFFKQRGILVRDI